MARLGFQSPIEVRVGDFEITNIKVWAQYGADIVTEVPAGANFEIHATYSIRNYKPGLTYWTTCMTVFDVTHNKAVASDEFGNHLGGGPLSAHDAVNAVMPNTYTVFRIRFFANQAAFAGCPAVSKW